MDATVVVAIVLGVLILVWLVLRLARRGATTTVTRRTSADPLPYVPPEVLDEAAAINAGGNKIAAIKLVREHTGLGLREAKDVVESLERGERQRIAGSPPPPPATTDGTPIDDDELRRLLADGHKIEAIKRVRERTGLGLREAKDYVEGLE